jgi:tripartite ATP-independent transporter DctP family solute receptor
MKRLRVCAASVAFMLILMSLGSTAASAGQKLKFGHIFETSHPYHHGIQWAAEEIKKRTAGRYEVEVFPSSVLGKEPATVEGLSLGTVDMTIAGLTNAATLYGPIAVGIAPFIYRDLDHWKKFSTSPVFAELAKGFEQKSGNTILALTYYGERHVTSNKPIRTPADMKGMKIRVPSGTLMLMFPKAVSANPAPMAFAEVYMALQQGVVDGQENPLPTILANKFYEVQKYISLTAHIADSHVTLVGAPTWKRLAEADRKTFRDVFAEAAERTSRAVRDAELNLVKWFKDNGVTVLEVDRKPFAAAVAKVVNGPDATWPKELYDRIAGLK